MRILKEIEDMELLTTRKRAKAIVKKVEYHLISKIYDCFSKELEKIDIDIETDLRDI